MVAFTIIVVESTVSIVPFITAKRKAKSQNPEVRATELLHRLFYGGAGRKFLGWQHADLLLLADGTWETVGDGGWRYWTVPSDPTEYNFWNPVWEHLKGNHRGVVAVDAKSVPFVSVDLDRHHAGVVSRDHMIRVLRAGRLLRRQFAELRWSVAEVNDRNGSTKFFGFAGSPIPLGEAVGFAKAIQNFLLESGLGDLEVFPFNCPHVGLPMRADKTCIVSSGVLSKCVRKKKADSRFVQFEAYSSVGLLDAIGSSAPYDENALLFALKRACANLPDCPVAGSVEPQATIIKFIGDSEGHSEGARSPKARGSYEEEPNALTRQLQALLELARRLRRVPSESEALSFIKVNRLYSGDWSDKEGRRKSRVRWILGHIADSFDPAKCSTAKYKVEFGKFDNWARTHVGTLREKVRRFVDEFGEIHEVQGRSVVDWMFVSVMLSILEFCFDDPNPDQSLPQTGPRSIWESSFRAGLIDVRWNDYKWAISRDWLEEIGVIEIFDRNWHFGHGSGQAMKWRPTEEFHRLHIWYKARRQPSVNEPVPLVKFLVGKQLPPPPLNYYLDTALFTAGFEPQKGHWKPPP